MELTWSDIHLKDLATVWGWEQKGGGRSRGTMRWPWAFQERWLWLVPSAVIEAEKINMIEEYFEGKSSRYSLWNVYCCKSKREVRDGFMLFLINPASRQLCIAFRNMKIRKYLEKNMIQKCWGDIFAKLDIRTYWKNIIQ